MVGGVVLVGEFAAFDVGDVGVGDGLPDAFEERVLVVVGGSAAVIAVEEFGVVGVGTNHEDVFDVFL